MEPSFRRQKNPCAGRSTKQMKSKIYAYFHENIIEPWRSQRKLLCELDVAEECFHCELDSEEDPGDSEDVENGAGSPQLSASTPDVLPL
ncbi:unnamed protein product [Caenorhabditis auriculariae]|uniref:Uncharacterized protein n=1 Tax=Caenorhabditis auriculariae TaxID=2777116 RepID=A0A8S1HDL2_9PELO|nr:unnamed protein product [Caenorhabditis auriculariae]